MVWGLSHVLAHPFGSQAGRHFGASCPSRGVTASDVIALQPIPLKLLSGKVDTIEDHDDTGKSDA